MITFGRCGPKNHSFESRGGCDELGDQVREYRSKQNARRVPMPSSTYGITSDPSGAVFAGLGFASAPSREVCERILQSEFELRLKLIHPDEYAAGS